MPQGARAVKPERLCTMPKRESVKYQPRYAIFRRTGTETDLGIAMRKARQPEYGNGERSRMQARMRRVAT
jgi:hypothetical protein